MMQCKAKSENLAHILGYQIWAVTRREATATRKFFPPPSEDMDASAHRPAPWGALTPTSDAVRPCCPARPRSRACRLAPAPSPGLLATGPRSPPPHRRSPSSSASVGAWRSLLGFEEVDPPPPSSIPTP